MALAAARRHRWETRVDDIHAVSRTKAATGNTVLTREEILDALWGVDYVAESNVVDRQIRNLRARLQNDWKRPRFIATIPGRGYRFVPTFTATG